jgi:hypothetical protein
VNTVARSLRPSTQEEINRRDNLRTLARTYGNAKLAEMLGISQATLSHFIGPKFSRNLKSHIAREYEVALKLAPGWLDTPKLPNADDAPVPAPKPAARMPAAQQPAVPPLPAQRTVIDIADGVSFIRAVDRIAAEEGVPLPDGKAADLIQIVVTEATKGGGKPDAELVSKLLRLMK